MIRNYFKIAWRNLIKNKIYSSINLLGLTIGMTCFILIALYIQFEISFDKFHEKSDRIYRIVQQQKGNTFRGTDFFALAPLPLSEAMKKDFPEVESITNIDVYSTLLVKDEKSFAERGLYTDEYYFDIFTVNVIEGTGKEALKSPNTILLTKSLAEKIFGGTSPVGKTILLSNEETMTVKGVVADPAINQHFTYDFITSKRRGTQFQRDLTNWVSNNYHAYVLLKEGQNDYKTLQDKMSRYVEITKPAYERQGFQFYPEYSLQPLEDIHLHSKINMEIEQNGDVQYVYFFTFLAFIILILASINYMNLATSRSTQRSKEVGVFKSLGADKRNLIFQYLGESVLLTLFSFLFAALLSVLLLPRFSELLDKNIPLDIMGNGWILALMLTLAILIGSLSGLYPAIFLSNVNPVDALKGKFSKKNKRQSVLRNVLVVGQFIAAISLISCSIIVYQQLQYTQKKKLGYNKNQIVHVAYTSDKMYEKEDVIKKQFLDHPNIHKVSISTQLPINVRSQGPVDNWEGNINKEPLYVYRTYVDYDFLDLFEMDIVEGRNFKRGIASDSTNAYILNEAAVKKLRWETAIGKKFNDGNVIGVVEDFHLQTFDLEIEPLFIKIRDQNWNTDHGEVILKIDFDDIKNTIAFIENKMKSIEPLGIFEVKFMDETYSKLYDKEKRLGYAFNIFSLLAVFIACIGLFGLVSFNVFQRTKEIGVRKVLGSSVFSIIHLLSKDFLKLILIAIITAVPITYYLMNNWLQDYIYRIDIEWWFFAIAGVITGSIALVTVVIQTLKAATANPVNSLKTE